MSVSVHDRTLIVSFGHRRRWKWLRCEEWTAISCWRVMIIWGRTDIAAHLKALLDRIGPAGTAGLEDGA